MPKLRDWLNKIGFDWENGRIIWQELKNGYRSQNNITSTKEIPHDHPILDTEFINEFGSIVGCPCFIAEDKEYIYFPQRYDGMTALVRVYKNIDKYLEGILTPYPGGE